MMVEFGLKCPPLRVPQMDDCEHVAHDLGQYVFWRLFPVESADQDSRQGVIRAQLTTTNFPVESSDEDSCLGVIRAQVPTTQVRDDW